MKVFVEEGVSPVIGVMLMLAITIIIASTVAAFACGASTRFEGAPSATLSVYCDGSVDEGDFNIIFEHLGGDAVSSGDLKIVTWIEDGAGGVIKTNHSAKSSRSASFDPPVRLPYVYGSEEEVSEFGEALWRPGTVAGTYDPGATAEFLGISEGELGGFIEKGTPVEVTIVHLPSGNTILRKKFLLG